MRYNMNAGLTKWLSFTVDGEKSLLIDFESRKVADWFSDFDKMAIRVGRDLTYGIKKQYEVLRASPTFAEYLNLGLGKPHLLTENYSGYYGVSLDKRNRMIMRPYPMDCSAKALKVCTTVIIKGVVDYHDGKENKIIP